MTDEQLPRCRCGAVCRPRQRTCQKCHAVTMRLYRKKKQDQQQREIEFLKNIIDQLSDKNLKTMKAFEERFPDRRVYVPFKKNDPYPPVSGYVVKFLPCYEVVIQCPDGEQVQAPLSRIAHDKSLFK